MLNRLIPSGIACLALVSTQTGAQAREKSAPPMRFSDGAIGTTGDECSLGDLCGSLAFPNGDRIDVYNGGAPRCKPYTLNIVRMHGETKLFDYKTETNKGDDADTGFGKKCGKFQNTTLTFDNGVARLDFFQSADGSIFSRWIGGVSDTNSDVRTSVPIPNSGATAAPGTPPVAPVVTPPVAPTVAPAASPAPSP